MSGGLQGKVAVIVGGGSGIGVASALELAGAGAIVVIGDIDGETAEAAATAVRDAGGRADAEQVDALDEAAVGAFFKGVVARHGAVDVVHCQPSSTILAPSVTLPLADMEKVLCTTLIGQFSAARAGAARMIAASRPGAIVLMASIGGFRGMPERAAYTSAAGGIVQLTRTLAVEWACHGIRVNALAPAWTLTAALVAYSEKFPTQLDLEELARRIPLGRLGDPEEVAKAVLFLASEASSFITGVTLPVDGGVLAAITTATTATGEN